MTVIEAVREHLCEICIIGDLADEFLSESLKKLSYNSSIAFST